jgi:hypothetical protein
MDSSSPDCQYARAIIKDFCQLSLEIIKSVGVRLSAGKLTLWRAAYGLRSPVPRLITLLAGATKVVASV